MNRCVICSALLNEENKSQEHIIHDALGGTLVSDKIYCNKCNSNFGSNSDTKFTQIFAPITGRIKLHRTRKTKGNSYQGVVVDEDENFYTATYKSEKVVKLQDSNLNHVRYEKNKFRPLFYYFNLDNSAFKAGIVKIAFNYALHCGLTDNALEKIFDYVEKKFTDNPKVIPFVGLTSFDELMEINLPNKIFHAVRIFNQENFLYAYVELFNTFQYYVLLSERCNFDIDTSFANLVEQKQPLPENLSEDLIPKDFKDADIIMRQYNINRQEMVANLKKYHGYDNLKSDEKLDLLFTAIGKVACEKIRKESYIESYEKLLKQQYDSANFKQAFYNRQNFKELSEFIQSFCFYTNYDEDCINLAEYKKYLPNGKSYPLAICELIEDAVNLNWYGHTKFYLLEEKLQTKSCQKTQTAEN